MKYNENRAIEMVEEEDEMLLHVAPSIYDDCILADGTPFRDLFRRCCMGCTKGPVEEYDREEDEEDDDDDVFFEYQWRRTPHVDLSECLNFATVNGTTEILFSEDGQFQALTWLDGDMRDCNTVLLAAKVATGEKITLGNVQQFLHEAYEMLGIPHSDKKIPDAFPLPYVYMCDLNQRFNLQKFYVEALSGRITAPDITLKARDGSFRVRIQLKHIDNREYRKSVDKLFERLGWETLHVEDVAHVDEWDEWHIEEERLTVNPPEVRTASIRMDADDSFNPVAQWWASEGLNFVLSYVYPKGSVSRSKNADFDLAAFIETQSDDNAVLDELTLLFRETAKRSLESKSPLIFFSLQKSDEGYDVLQLMPWMRNCTDENGTPLSDFLDMECKVIVGDKEPYGLFQKTAKYLISVRGSLYWENKNQDEIAEEDLHDFNSICTFVRCAGEHEFITNGNAVGAFANNRKMQVFVWDGHDVKVSNTLLLAIQFALESSVSCDALQGFLKQSYERMGINLNELSPRPYIPLTLAPIIRNIKKKHNPEDVTIEELKGRLTAPDIVLRATNDAFLTHIRLRKGDSQGEFVWELHQSDPKTGESIFDVAISSVKEPAAFRALIFWWKRVGFDFGLFYYQEQEEMQRELNGEAGVFQYGDDYWRYFSFDRDNDNEQLMRLTRKITVGSLVPNF